MGLCNNSVAERFGTNMRAIASLLSLVIFLSLLIAGCSAFTPSPEEMGTSTPSVASPTPTEKLCPQATAEAFSVDPIPAVTDQLSITVHVNLGKMEQITIVTESGTFVSKTGFVEITLLPNTIHHLEVRGEVLQVEGTGGLKGCLYGGYTLVTTFGAAGEPLMIEQRSP